MSIVPHPLPISEGKVYKTKKNRNKHLSDEEAAMKELETILSVKNRRPCDCEGQEHDLVANCLGCGRIVCSAEGPGNCLTCGNLVLNKDQKSRLQEHVNLIPGTANTSPKSGKQGNNFRVIDDQFNYFSMADQKWLTDKDRHSLRQERDELQAAKYRRKLVLNVDIDNMIGGAESVPEIDDFEQSVRKLQIKSEELLGGSNSVRQTLLLRDIVASESAKDYQFTYMSQADRDGTKKGKNQPKAKKARSAKSSKNSKAKNGYSIGSNKQAAPNSKSSAGGKGPESQSNASIKKNKHEKIITQTKLPNVKKKTQPNTGQVNPVPATVKNVWKENITKKEAKVIK